MSDRWFIIKDSQTVGPLTAEAIRASLRDGTFDPFDLVMRDGSTVRRELVEVDELFQSSDVVYDASANGAASMSGPKSLGVGIKGADQVAGQGQLMLAARSEETSPYAPAGGLAPRGSPPKGRSPQGAPRKKRRDPRHFHLMDGRGRMMGPITASEIQALFYKGVLDKTVKVMRDDSGAKVSVGRFVAVYSESKASMRGPQQGAHPMLQGGVTPSAAQRLLKGRSRPGLVDHFSPLSLVAILLGTVLCCIAGWIFYFHSQGDLAARPTPPAKGTIRELPDVAEQRRNQSRQDRQIAKKKRQAALDAAAKREADRLRAAGARREVQGASDRRTAEKIKDKQKTREERRVAREKKVRAQMKARQQAQLQSKPPTKPIVVASAPVATGVAALVDGQNINGLGPMTFDKSSVQGCEGTCTVTFSGAGGSVRVAFFKQKWGPALVASSGSVYISGLVRKSGGGTKIMLSNVK